jgi:hypothetical protein
MMGRRTGTWSWICKLGVFSFLSAPLIILLRTEEMEEVEK